MSQVTREEFDSHMASDPTALGFVLSVVSGTAPTVPVEQCFIIDSDPVTEIGRMNGYGIALLSAMKVITPEEYGAFRLKWRKIIKD